jgi:NTE family protein
MTAVLCPDHGTLAVCPVALALEGGGSLGAFTWGVLDRILDVPGLRIEVVSGTSAGAMNAALLVQGLATGGPPAARRLLETFWRRVAIAAGSLPGPVGAWLHLVGGAMAPVIDAMRHANAALQPRVSSPGINPLRGILTDLLDPAVFGHPDAPGLVVAATRVRTGQARLFRDAEVTVDALLASACLPQLFPAIEIDGEVYWDGGYTSNPPLRPLIEGGAPPDVLIVRAKPLERLEAPTGTIAVQERIDEITFGSPLRGELRTLAVAQALLAGVPHLPSPLARLHDARLHMIGAERAFQAMPGGSRQDPTWAFLSEMHELGSKTAAEWLADHLHAVGKCSSLDLSLFTGAVDNTGTGTRAA